VGKALQDRYTLNTNHAVGVNRYHGTHLLQNSNKVNDLWLNRGTTELRRSLCSNCRKQYLLGCPHRWIGKFDFRPSQTFWGAEPGSSWKLLDNSTKGSEYVKVEIHWTIADLATAKAWDESLPETVQQRPAEQDWNS
jgi:hypothetical protein